MNNFFSNARLKNSLRDGVGIFFAVGAVLILKACASIGAPGGGPEDKIAPTIVETSPTTDSTRVSRLPEIKIVFSELMDRVSVENALFMMPFPTLPPELDWDGHTLNILLRDSLPPNRTCVISIGSDAKDRHQNPLGRTFTTAFSTGKKIDRGSIIGHIQNLKPGTAIWAYTKGDTSNTDSLLFKQRADYVTQVGKNGEFSLNYLTAGNYRVYAVIDADNNFLYTPGVDGIGLPTRDVFADEKRPDYVEFTTFSEDTLRLGVVDAITYKNRLVKIQINSLVRDSFLRTNFSIVDSADGKNIPIHNGFKIDRSAFTEYRLFCDSLQSDRTYRVGVKKLYSSLDSAQGLEFYFRGDSRESDEPRLEWLNASSALLPQESLDFRFSIGVDTSEIRRFSKLYEDSTRRDMAWHWTSPGLGILNSKFFQPGRSYHLEIFGDSVNDQFKRTLADSTIHFRFLILPEDTLGVISGSVIDEDSLASGKIYMQFRRVDGGVAKATVLESPGEFTRDLLVPGFYKISGYRDSDHNGEWTKGRSWPLIFSERTLMVSDSTIVRRNWETSNILLRLKK